MSPSCHRTWSVSDGYGSCPSLSRAAHRARQSASVWPSRRERRGAEAAEHQDRTQVPGRLRPAPQWRITPAADGSEQWFWMPEGQDLAHSACSSGRWASLPAWAEAHARRRPHRRTRHAGAFRSHPVELTKTRSHASVPSGQHDHRGWRVDHLRVPRFLAAWQLSEQIIGCLLAMVVDAMSGMVSQGRPPRRDEISAYYRALPRCDPGRPQPKRHTGDAST
jgi:hypothetical protein